MRAEGPVSVTRREREGGQDEERRLTSSMISLSADSFPLSSICPSKNRACCSLLPCPCPSLCNLLRILATIPTLTLAKASSSFPFCTCSTCFCTSCADRSTLKRSTEAKMGCEILRQTMASARLANALRRGGRINAPRSVSG